MSTHMTRETSALYLMADHLDAILAAGEDLLLLRAIPQQSASADTAASGDAWPRLPHMIEQARSLEICIVSRVLQARARARDLGRQDALIGGALALFVGATAQLTDAAHDLADNSGGQFDTGLDPLAYLRTRGVISAESGSLTGIDAIAVGEDFLIAALVPLGPLMDVVARLLDVLDTAYGLYDEGSAEGPAATPEPSAVIADQPLSLPQKLGHP